MCTSKEPKVAVVMGSDSDLTVMKSCLKVLQHFDIEFEAMVCSAHRTPDKAAQLAKNAEENGFDLIISAAGKAAHLPGVLAAYTPLPVIGVPIKSMPFDGMDALMSIVQMPSGVPVATVAVDGAENAAILAVQILSIAHPELRERIKKYKQLLAERVEAKNNLLHDLLKDIQD